MILITGATGFVGQNVVNQLMARQIPCRCIIPRRKVDNLPWDTRYPYAPQIIVGNILDEEALFQAVTGVHTIIHLENAQWWGRERDLERIELGGTRALIAAARAARVGRIITLSHIGASASSAFVLHRVKGQAEEIIRNSGLAFTIIRSGIAFGPNDQFINNLLMMIKASPIFFFMPGYGEVVLHPIYIDDLVEAVIRSLDKIDIIDEIVEIGGLEYITLQHLILTIMPVSGTYRTIVRVPPYTMRLISSLYGFFLPRALMTPQWLDILATHRTANLGNVFEYFDLHPRRIEDTLLTYLPRSQSSFSAFRFSFRRRPRGY